VDGTAVTLFRQYQLLGLLLPPLRQNSIFVPSTAFMATCQTNTSCHLPHSGHCLPLSLLLVNALGLIIIKKEFPHILEELENNEYTGWQNVHFVCTRTCKNFELQPSPIPNIASYQEGCSSTSWKRVRGYSARPFAARLADFGTDTIGEGFDFICGTFLEFLPSMLPFPRYQPCPQLQAGCKLKNRLKTGSETATFPVSHVPYHIR
jgi:hypothetical protein